MTTVFKNGTRQGAAYHARAHQLPSAKGHSYEVEIVIFDNGTDDVHYSFSRTVPEYHKTGGHISPMTAIQLVLRDPDQFV